MHQDILEPYLEACQTSKMKPLTRMVNGWNNIWKI